MLTLKGIPLPVFPFSNHRKVTDIFYYEGPILSHFKGDNDTDFLYYWVDKDDNINRWLIFYVEEHQIIEYLKGYASLRDLVYNLKNHFVYTVDIDRDLNYSNTMMITPFELPETYVPEKESFYTASAIPSYYENRFKQITSFNYRQILIDNSLYLMLSSRDERLDKMVEAEYAGEFMKVMSKSCKEYGYFDFYNTFTRKFHNPADLLSAAIEIKNKVTPLVVNNEIHSFCIAITNDFILSDSDEEIKTWEKNFIKNFKHDVVDINYNSEEEVKRIKSKFGEEQRAKIYEPYFKILNNEKYGLSVTNKDFKEAIPRPKILVQNQDSFLLPQTLPLKGVAEKEISNEKVLHNITFETLKGQDISKLTIKKILQNTLFDKIIDTFEGELTNINYQGYRIKFKDSLKYLVSFDGKTYSLYFEPLEITATGEKKEQYLSNFYEKFIALFENPAKTADLSETFQSLIESAVKE